jgi:uncharacterized membrane protein YhaH (DUF805 family)
MLQGRLPGSGIKRAAVGAAVAGLGTCALVPSGEWIVRAIVHPPDRSPDVGFVNLISALVVMLILTLLGAAAGLVSGRLRDALVSWAAATVGLVLVTQISLIVDPGQPTSEDGFWMPVVYAAVVLLPFVAGGHILGVGARVVARQGKANPRIIGPLVAIAAGLALCAGLLLNTTQYDDGTHPVSAAAIAAAIKAQSLPTQLGDFELDESYSYDAGPATGRAYYAIWHDSSRRELQVVLNTGVPAGLPYAFEDSGGLLTFTVFEGDTCLQVFAPDLATLRAAVAALRPDLSPHLEQEIANPATPQPKVPPTQ